MSRGLQCGDRWLDLSSPVIMGVLNVTPDSFSDGGKFLCVDDAVRHAERMAADGARVIDIGAESTRPGAAPVSPQEEMDRLLPVLQALRQQLDVVISIDTSTPAVMTESARGGAGLINDVRALLRPGALAAAAATGLPVCLMHMQGEPGTMQQAPRYGDVAIEVADFLGERIRACLDAGISRDRLLLDPGFGFGKTLEHNLALLARLPALAGFGLPLLVGMSRKTMLGAALGGAPVDRRLNAGLGAASLAVWLGADIIRTHDPGATREAIAVAAAARQLIQKEIRA